MPINADKPLLWKDDIKASVAITPEILKENPKILQTLRMATCPLVHRLRATGSSG
jgi:hypothetical protein